MRTLSFVLDGIPVPKGRPKSGKGRVYTPERTRAAEQQLGMLIRSKRVTFDGDVMLRIDFRVSRYRGDLDNLIKWVADSLQLGGALKNDRQVKEIHAVEIASEAESTTVVVTDYVQRVE